MPVVAMVEIELGTREPQTCTAAWESVGPPAGNSTHIAGLVICRFGEVTDMVRSTHCCHPEAFNALNPSRGPSNHSASLYGHVHGGPVSRDNG
jgi:hypothetical protein